MAQYAVQPSIFQKVPNGVSPFGVMTDLISVMSNIAQGLPVRQIFHHVRSEYHLITMVLAWTVSKSDVKFYPLIRLTRCSKWDIEFQSINTPSLLGCSNDTGNCI